jgi:hypothetical protein
MVDRRGFEPRIPACKASVFPIIPTAQIVPMLIQAGAMLGTTQRKDLPSAFTLQVTERPRTVIGDSLISTN